MILRTSISNTKQFLKKTLGNFKSFFSRGYQRLPKTPAYSHFSYTNTDFGKNKATSSPLKKNQIERAERNSVEMINRERHERKERENVCVKGVREESRCLVARKLKELEMLDMSNVDHILDIEEVLHYYSRLTCPAYLEIVDRFFVEMYAEFVDPSSPTYGVKSRLRQPLMVNF